MLPHAGLPIPETFNFKDPEGCAKQVAAIMSNASGGFLIKDVKLSYHEGWGCANLSGNGMHVYWSNGKKGSIQEVCKMAEESTKIDLGTVSSDQYGEGWKRAIWS